jgi:glycosyltransferase involved in cell wall biosynthesis
VHYKNPLTVLYSAARIAAVARRNGYDLIHAHSRVPAWVALLASKMAGVPFVVTLHVRFGNRSPLVYKPYRLASRVICVSESARSAMGDLVGDRTVVIRNGLPDARGKWRGKYPPWKLLFVGRLSPVKGIDVALRALCRLKSYDWTLDVVGDGPLRKELESFVAEEGLEGRVFFHGFCPDVEPWMMGASLLLFPSLYEGLPLTLAQSIQIGLPALASDIPEVREMTVKPSSLVPAGDAKAWEEALRGIFSGDAEPPRLKAGYDLALDKMVDKTLALYEEVVFAVRAAGRGRLSSC